jgi:glyoxylase-like metal-dependent hydrolase (beta-lactamase superfamily II)
VNQMAADIAGSAGNQDRHEPLAALRRPLATPCAESSVAGALRHKLGYIGPTKGSTSIMHKQTIGAIEVSAISDGVLNIPADRVIGMTGAETRQRLGLGSDDPVPIDVNSFLLKIGDTYALVDAGCGASFGPTLGKQAENLRAAGVAPEAIRYVFLTHFHPDHSNGLIDGEGRAVYPNAELFAHENEARFWLDEELPAGATDMMRNSQKATRRGMAAYPDRLHRVRDGEAMPGISAFLQAGHTPGHTGWLVESGGAGILIWGDIVHLTAIQVAQPDAAMTFDIDPDGARASRRRVFDRVATDRLFVAGAHLNFPGFGTLTRTAGGYRYEPTA